ncbi:MAG TPA: response regulator [Bryobacteraceae bacterium]|nr:response regulator [Bryobacteraceae bacterium]
MELRVLIVDDSSVMRAFIRRVLELSGLEIGLCLEASNGEEALRVLENNWVDAVLTDINMPTMDGEELLRRMSEHAVLRLIPVLVVSTDRTEGRVQKMLTLGAKGYVTKPFAPETLREELERSLAVVNGTE